MNHLSRRQAVISLAIAAVGLTAGKAIGAEATGEKSMSVERINYPHLDAPVGPYVHGVRHNGLLYLSGLTAFDTPAQAQDVATQATTVFSQLKGILDAEGTDFSNLIKVTIFVTEFGDVDELRTALFNAYGKHLPASSLIQVKSLFAPDLKIEVEAIVALPQR